MLVAIFKEGEIFKPSAYADMQIEIPIKEEIAQDVVLTPIPSVFEM